MPKLKTSAQYQKNREFLAAVAKHLTMDKLSKGDFAHLMGMSRST